MSTLPATRITGAAAAATPTSATIGIISTGAAAAIITGRGGAGLGRSDPGFSLRGGLGILRVELSHALAPHADEVGRGDLVDVLPCAFQGWQRVAPDRALAPLLARLLDFIGRALGSPGQPAWLAQMLHRAFDALLVNEVDVVEARRAVREHLEHDVLGRELQRGGDSVVTRIEDVAGAVHGEFLVAQLELAVFGVGVLFGVV